MARFLVGSTALLGHIVPLAPIVSELVRRGHEVCWYTGAHYRTRVEATGATLITPRYAEDLSTQPVNERFPRRAQLTGIHSLLFDIRYIFAAELVGQVQDMQEALRRFPADVLLADSAFLAAECIHELDGPPWATLNPFAINISGRETPPFGLGSPPAATRFGRFRVRAQQHLAERYLYRNSTEFVDRLRSRLGLSPTGEVFWDRTLSPYLYMQGSVRGLEYPRDDLPGQFHFIGPTLSAGDPSPFEPPDWWDQLDSGKPVVLVTQGTLSTNPEQLLLPTIYALANEDVLTIATTGGAPPELLTDRGLPANTRVESFIPFDHLLPRVDVMVTNGGYNGVQMGLSRGIPLVVAGATEDKLEVNARVAWAGVGIDLGTATPDESLIRRAVRTILDDTRFYVRANELAHEFGEHDGASTGAELLVELARTGRPVLRTASSAASIS